MANATSVYASAQPLQGNVADLIGQQEQVDLAYDKMGLDNAQQIAAQKQAKALADQKAREADAKDVRERFKEGIGNTEPIKSKNFDDAKIAYVTQIAEPFYKLRTEYEQKINSGTITPTERQNYEIKLNNLMKQPAVLNQKFATLKTVIEEYNKGRNTFDANGNPNLHPDPDFENFINSKAGYVPIYDEKTDSYYVGFTNEDGSRKDTNNDGKIDSLDLVKLDDILEGTNRFKFNAYYDRGDALKEDIAAIGFTTTQTDNGDVVRTRKTYDKNEISKLGQNRFFSPNGSITPFARSMALQNNVDPNNIAEVQKIADKYKMDLIASMKPEDIQERKNSSLDWYKARQNNKEEPTTKDFSYTSVRKQNGEVLGDIYQIGGKTVKRSLTGGGEEKLRGFEIGKDGTVYAIVDATRPKLSANQFIEEKRKPKSIYAKDYTYDDYLKEPEFQTKRYSSKGKGAENDVVGYYYRQIKDDKGEYIESTKELRDLLQGKKPKEKAAAPIQFDAQGNIILN